MRDYANAPTFQQARSDARILIVTDAACDATMICDLLVEQYPNVTSSTVPTQFVDDFHRRHPQVLVLAFRSVADSERYYFNLFRNEAMPLPPSYQTLLLCGKEDVRRAYELCRSDQFDDYVLFWPMVLDAPRLAMAVHLALRAGSNARMEEALAKIASQARQIAHLEHQLERQLAIGVTHAEKARTSLRTVKDQVHAAVDGFSKRLLETGLDGAVSVCDTERVADEFARLDRDAVQPPLQQAVEATRPVEQWISSIKSELAIPLHAARLLGEHGQQVRPMLLVVDDDLFMRKLLARVLQAADYLVVAVASGHEALSAMRKRAPDLIIMDVNLPDLNGIEVTRRLKMTDGFAGIPVIMLTGQSEKEVFVASRGAGAVDFVAKPFDRQILLGKVSKHLPH